MTRAIYGVAWLLAACSADSTTWLGAELEQGMAGANDAGAVGEFFARYEAEAPENTLSNPVVTVVSDDDCEADGVSEGAVCSSGGKYVAHLLGRSPCEPPTSFDSRSGCKNDGGGIRFNGVTVPADGDYDVTWWYHCGADDDGRANVFGDTTCGGQDYDTGPNTGCRPHQIDVNDAPVSSEVDGERALYFHFPCYASEWGVLHGATTTLTLSSGANAIYIHAPGVTALDSADIDAIHVQQAGHGTAEPPAWPRLVTPVVIAN